MNYDFNRSHPTLSVYLHVLMDQEEDFVRQNFSLVISLYHSMECWQV